jgi:crossover junction endonuclease EME1
MEGNDAAFCMDVGQVKSGEDKLDTFVKMLQEVNRVTASMAYGIAAQYPCVTDLVRGMRMHGPTMLEDVKVRALSPCQSSPHCCLGRLGMQLTGPIQKSANKNGALTDSRIGPAASKRLYKVFTGLDPTSTDV